MTVIDKNRVLELLTELVNERGEDYVYKLDARIDAVIEHQQHIMGTDPDWASYREGDDHEERQQVFLSDIWSDANCNYEEQGQPSCAVGVVFHKIDPALCLFAQNQQVEGMGSAVNVARAINREGVYEFTDEARQVLGTFQYQQDEGRPYGRILANVKAA